MSTEIEHRFPCNSCGSDLRYDPTGRHLTCDHCGATAAIPAPSGTIAELDFQAASANNLPAKDIAETRVTSCPNCGAQTEFDADVHATECPFCATPVVTDTGTHRQIKPQAVLPFGLDEPSARDGVTKWLGSLWFAPNGLQEYARKGRKLNGIYVPYWTFDADTKSKYSGQRGTHYYVTKTVMRDGKKTQVQERKTRWKPASGQVARFFDDVLVLASKSLPKHYTDGLQPWDLSSLEPYQPEYLAGFRAEGYQVEIDDGYTEARAHMDAVINRDVRSDIGGDDQRVDKISTNVNDVTFKHILLPVWLAAYKYRGKTYRFVVNGRTGEVQGERPYSIWKIGAVIAVILAVIAGIVIANGQ
ncbi:replication restart DNA helicase PriA [Yoonia tamlensis]|uniref:Replication restart DNA helicase PriA n=1 Tax=Yoonia tamlensis TaxID=390270 RepID=A0A1I6FWB9_9RHOB|nr:primosomal protein N' (replication factor Y) - superfamily II helicase [Yoonia tamlensis]SFR34220.1 replication restart DNA helicase PriA [Yoonia tamlensis]